MQTRLNVLNASPTAVEAMLGLTSHLAESGLERSLLRLVRDARLSDQRLRVLPRHALEGRARGRRTEQRLYLLDAWRETPFFSERERAALEWTEALTMVSTSHVPDEIYGIARAQFSERELVDLTLAVVTINGWNRICIGFRVEPGNITLQAAPRVGALRAAIREARAQGAFTMFSKVGWIAMAAITVMTAGCAGRPVGSSRAASPRAPENFTPSRRSRVRPPMPWLGPATDWWSTFQDPQLDQLEKEALAGSPSLAAAEARIDKAGALAGLARAATRPGVDASFDATDQRYSEHDVVPHPPAGDWDTASRLALDFRYELDFWHREPRRARGGVEPRRRRTRRRVRRPPCGIGGSRARVRRSSRDSTTDSTSPTRRSSNARGFSISRASALAAGLDSRVELEQAEGACPPREWRRGARRIARACTATSLPPLLGRGPDRGLEIVRPQLGTAAGAAPALPSRLARGPAGRRPDVIASRRRVQAAGHDIAAAKADFFPHINLLAFAGFQSIGLSELLDAGSRIIGAGPALRLPIFDRRRLRGHLAARDADYDAAVEQYNATLVEALRDTATSSRPCAPSRAKRRAAACARRRPQVPTTSRCCATAKASAPISPCSPSNRGARAAAARRRPARA